MNRASYGFRLFGVTLVSLLVLRPLSAASPTIIMVYGDQLQNPVFIQSAPDHPLDAPTEFLWNTIRNGARYDAPKGNMPANLAGRPFLKIAMFWDDNAVRERLNHPELLQQLKPEDAGQHAWLFLPTASQSAVVVATPLHVSGGVPVPASLSDFYGGWALSAEDRMDAKRLGIPGM